MSAPVFLNVAASWSLGGAFGVAFAGDDDATARGRPAAADSAFDAEAPRGSNGDGGDARRPRATAPRAAQCGRTTVAALHILSLFPFLFQK